MQSITLLLCIVSPAWYFSMLGMMFSNISTSCSCFDLLLYKSCKAELKSTLKTKLMFFNQLAARSHLVFFMFLQLLDSHLDRKFSSWKMTCDSHVILRCEWPARRLPCQMDHRVWEQNAILTDSFWDWQVSAPGSTRLCVCRHIYMANQ